MKPLWIHQAWKALRTVAWPLAAAAQLPPPPPSLPLLPPPPPPPETPASLTPEPLPNPAPLPPLTPEERDPFWPIGYRPTAHTPLKKLPSKDVTPAQPPPPTETPSPLQWNEAREQLRIGGYFRMGGRTSAYINNTIVSPGDIVTVPFKGREYRWRVESIEAQAIRLRPLDSRVIEKSLSSTPEVPK